MLFEEIQYWKEVIREAAKELGFVAVGFTYAEPISGLDGYLRKRIQLGLDTPFEPFDIQKRIAPKAVWPECRTVVVLAYPLPLSRVPENEEGILARSAVGEDYHRVVTRALNELINRMLAAGWKYETPRIQVDTGPLNERALAARSGIGWLGKNQQLIVPKYGSFIALALVLLDQELPQDNPIPEQCGACQSCVQACPAQIIGKEHFSAQNCLSFLTQSKEVLTDEQIKLLGRRIFGCDTCQEVCPHNRKRLMEEQTGRFELTRGIDLLELLNISKRQFDEKFRPTAAGWRGKGILQRNAYFALLNKEDERLEDWLKERARGKKSGIPLVLQPYVLKQEQEK